MATLSTRTFRDKYRTSTLENLLRRALIAEKVCEVDRSDAKRIDSPYASTPSAVVQALAGTYTPATFTTTDDTLNVNNEIIVSEHIFDFEEVLSKFDLFAARTEAMSFEVVRSVDDFVLNNLCEDGTGAYTTPVGGFSSANTPVILSNIAGQLAGYSESYKGLYLVIENTDLAGFMQWQMTAGFSVSDTVLRNGFLSSILGFDIYVTRTGLFRDGSSGTTSFTNAGHRVAGVKGMTTYAQPRGVRFEEKMVSGKTGMELVCVSYVGFKAWTPKLALTIDITLS